MIKYSLILLGIYFLYYGANIVYDLYLKKQKTTESDTTEEFSLDIAENENSPTQVNIEDVEDLRIPNSYLKEGFQTNNDELQEARPDLDDLRSRFESEEDLDDEHSENSIVQTTEQSLSEANNGKTQPEVTTNQKEESFSRKNEWKEMLRLSETTVQMVANYDGQKVYSIV